MMSISVIKETDSNQDCTEIPEESSSQLQESSSNNLNGPSSEEAVTSVNEISTVHKTEDSSALFFKVHRENMKTLIAR